MTSKYVDIIIVGSGMSGLFLDCTCREKTKTRKNRK